MKTRMLAVLVSAVVISGCRQRLVESMDQPVHIGLEELELVDQTVLTGQDEIDFLRAKAERDLETVLAIDPDHPGAEQIRRALADLDWRERQLHWRIANGFEGPDAVYTQEEFWRRMIEDRDLLELTDDAVRAIRARLDVLMRTDTTIAASGSGTDVVCTADAYLDWDASGDLYFDESGDLLTFSTLSRRYTEMHVAGLGRVGVPQRHRFNGLAEPDARSSNGNLVTYVPPVMAAAGLPHRDERGPEFRVYRCGARRDLLRGWPPGEPVCRGREMVAGAHVGLLELDEPRRPDHSDRGRLRNGARRWRRRG